MPPDLGIAKITGCISVGQKILTYNDTVLFKGYTVKAFCKALNLPDAFATLILDKACVHKPQFAVVDDSTTREASVLITVITRSQCNGKILPICQVIADNVSPMHRSPLGIIRMMLEKRVILTVIVYESVRVVYPTPLTCYVKDGFFCFNYSHIKSFLCEVISNFTFETTS